MQLVSTDDKGHGGGAPEPMHPHGGGAPEPVHLHDSDRAPERKCPSAEKTC
jgi:hypothetical protein